MDSVISSLEEGLNGLVERISRYEDIESQVQRIVELDRTFVGEVKLLRQQYDACRRIEALQDESEALDNEINTTLLQLSECRKELENTPRLPDPEQTQQVNAENLLDYAIKITKFTRRMPGVESLVPWPTEDNLRQGMLAALAVQGQEEEQSQMQQDADHMEVHAEPDEHTQRQTQQGSRARQSRTTPRKISLDFDSDEE